MPLAALSHSTATAVLSFPTLDPSTIPPATRGGLDLAHLVRLAQAADAEAMRCNHETEEAHARGDAATARGYARRTDAADARKDALVAVAELCEPATPADAVCALVLAGSIVNDLEVHECSSQQVEERAGVALRLITAALAVLQREAGADLAWLRLSPMVPGRLLPAWHPEALQPADASKEAAA